MTVEDPRDEPAREQMQEPQEPPREPETEPAPEPRRLTRTSHDRILGGVAGGLGRYFGIDPIIPRIVFAALVFAGGFGVLAYLAAWLFVPDERTGRTAASGSRMAALAGVVVLVAAIAVVSEGQFLWFAGPGLFVLAIAALLGYAIWTGSGRDGGGVAGRIVVLLLLGVLAVAGMVAVTIGAALGGTAVMAGVVIVAGLLVVAGAASGRMRWLLVPAVLLAIPVGVVAAADIDVDGGVGERHYRPATVAQLDREFELGVGELIVDLRGVDLPSGVTPLDVRLGIGRAVVVVDEDVCVAPNAEVGMGDAIVLGRRSTGVDVRVEEQPVAAPGRSTLALDAEVGIGEIRVVRDLFDLDRDRDGPPFFDPPRLGGGPDLLGEACGTA